jgi:uncharacterized protein (DUF3084 family)
MDFQFNAASGEKITFRLFFEDGILPTEFPPIREKMTRAEMAAAKAAKTEAQVEAEARAVIITAAAEAIAAVADNGEVKVEVVSEEQFTTETTEQSAHMEARFHVTGEQRKALVAAISTYTNEASILQSGPYLRICHRCVYGREDRDAHRQTQLGTTGQPRRARLSPQRMLRGIIQTKQKGPGEASARRLKPGHIRPQNRGGVGFFERLS